MRNRERREVDGTPHAAAVREVARVDRVEPGGIAIATETPCDRVWQRRGIGGPEVSMSLQRRFVVARVAARHNPKGVQGGYLVHELVFAPRPGRVGGYWLIVRSLHAA